MVDQGRIFVAVCASGLEELLAKEILSFQGRIILNSPGAVTFEGTIESAYRACLWSRFASRILMRLAEFPGSDTDSIYGNASEVEWAKHLSVNGSFSVDCTSSRSSVVNTKYCALRVKDSIVDQFRERFGKRPSVNLTRPDVRIHLYLSDESTAISLDLSGESLHRRGYRTEGGEAPLKESLAAGIVARSGWSGDVSSFTIFLDPMCGSGTLLIEAAFMFGDIAPGIKREYFGFLGWLGHEKKIWERLILEAHKRKQTGMTRKWPRIIGYDASSEAVNMASGNIEKAGLKGFIHVERKELAYLHNPFSVTANRQRPLGLMVANPPYGERLGSINAARYLYRCLNRKIKDGFNGWRLSVFSSHSEFIDEIDMIPVSRLKLYNGPIACHLRIFDIPLAPDSGGGYARFSPAIKENTISTDFSNRLRKNLRHLKKWAQREAISCFRLYDRDIPEYNVTIDVYEKWILVQEYTPPRGVDPEKANARFKQSVSETMDVLGVPRRMIFTKRRSRQKGNFQYQKLNRKGKFKEVREYNCRFLVNFTDYIDTGLFLDHRIVRRMIQEMAGKKRFLNLYGYTGSATVNAALGGARSSVTVDHSPVYLEWARDNLALNGFSDINHKMVRSDCMTWLSDAKERFDIIFADPPTYSNRRVKKCTFDVQRDHAALIKMAMRRLEPGGLMIFSTNFRRFRPDVESLKEFHLEDFSHASIPPDFSRRPAVHYCWNIRHK
ncbi:MAG: bifunctional 23S rRNA (guanine(2069)-N(7))-methyltransferase RlmK/23S rRNA (guanine(2445)-N(2))-methyltransferase RlmL [Deltaproteobacteria bacterium]|nr:bifunctional 23S rRNA (guanine(2069)-N(7))-methyltransferase RlmK/23S rRNA (guanine(2445)-N(2))-methyltransferase RlmL [Deltaproteobacteria bacterium]